MQKEHQRFEGVWELQADEKRVAFSNLQSYAAFRENAILAVPFLISGVTSGSYLAVTISDGTPLGRVPIAVWVGVAIALVLLPVLIGRVRPRRQGLQVVAERGKLAAVRYYRGALEHYLDSATPCEFFLDDVIKHVWEEGYSSTGDGKTYKVCEVSATAIVAAVDNGEKVELAWSADRVLAVETARKLARVCGVGLRDESGHVTLALDAEELEAQASPRSHQSDFQLAPPPPSLEGRVEVGTDRLVVMSEPLMVGWGVRLIVATVMFSVLTAVAVSWVFALVGVAAALSAGRLPKVRHVVVTLTADGVEFNGDTTLWADVQQVHLSEPFGAKFSMTAVELIVDDKPKTIGLGFIPPDAQEWLLMAFQRVGGFSK